MLHAFGRGGFPAALRGERPSYGPGVRHQRAHQGAQCRQREDDIDPAGIQIRSRRAAVAQRSDDEFMSEKEVAATGRTILLPPVQTIIAAFTTVIVGFASTILL